MKLSLKLLLLVGISLLVPQVNAAEFSPYVGADAQLHNIAAKGSNTLSASKKAPGLNAYAGLQVFSNLGVELGANIARHQKNGASTKLKGLHLSAVGSYPLKSLSDNLSLIGSLGVTNIKYTHQGQTVKFNYKKLRPRLGLGFHYDLTPCVAWRTLGSWTGSFSKKASGVTPKNSLGASTGLVYKF